MIGVTDALEITDDFEIADLDFRIDNLTHTFAGDITALPVHHRAGWQRPDLVACHFTASTGGR